MVPPADVPWGAWQPHWADAMDIPVQSCGARHVFRVYASDASPIPGKPLLVCLHGAGYTGMTFSAMSYFLRDSCTVLAAVRSCDLHKCVLPLCAEKLYSSFPK